MLFFWIWRKDSLLISACTRVRPFQVKLNRDVFSIPSLEKALSNGITSHSGIPLYYLPPICTSQFNTFTYRTYTQWHAHLFIHCQSSAVSSFPERSRHHVRCADQSWRVPTRVPTHAPALRIPHAVAQPWAQQASLLSYPLFISASPA